MALLGNNLIVSLGGSAIASSKSCSITFECGVTEVSSPVQGSYKNYVTNRKSWKVTTSYLVTGVKTSLLRVGQSYTLSFGVRGDASDKVSGTAICTTAKIDGARGALAQGSFEFVGNGELT